MRMVWTLVLPQSFPLGLRMPSPLRVLVMSVIPLPASARSKMRLTMREASGSGCKVGALLRPVLHHHPVVAEGGVAGDPEAARGRLAHPPRDLLGEILAVEFVHALDDGLHELARGGVVGVLGDGDDSNALAPEHGLEGDGVLPLAGEAGELPDQNLPERSVGLGGCVDHLAELRAVGDAPALGLIHVLAEDDVAVLLCVVPERPQLGGDGQVHVLAVTGDSGVEGHGRVVGVLVHRCVLLCSFLVVPAGLGPLSAFPPQPLPLVHVQADGLAEELAHGAALFLQQLLHLLRQLRGHREGDGLTGCGHSLFLPP